MNARPSAGRLPRNRRVMVRHLPEMRLTDRDRQIVLLVYDYRAVTAEIVGRVLFSPQAGAAQVSSRCLHRLKLLYHHGFLARHARPVNGDHRGVFIYTLDERGSYLVAEMLETPIGELDWRAADNQMVRGPFIDHLLLTNTVRAALEVGAVQRGYAVANWHDDRALRRTPLVVTDAAACGRARVELVPDGSFYLVRGQQAAAYYLELDRGTETVCSNTGAKDFAGKVRAYLRLAQTRPLRVLTVVAAGAQRLNNLRATAAALGDRDVFHFAPYADATDASSVLSARIWQCAGGGPPNALLP